MDLSLANLEVRLAAREAKVPSRLVAPRRAAVAVVLRYPEAGGGHPQRSASTATPEPLRGEASGRSALESPEVLLMRRVERADDRWSGHVSFPGGREEEEDADLLETSMRETLEEVGVDLRERGRLLGRLDGIMAMARGRLLPMSITPYVFVVSGPLDCRLGPEAAAVFWLPLGLVASGALDDRYPYQHGPVKLDLPCWRYRGETVWGLTHRMLRDLLRLLQ